MINKAQIYFIYRFGVNYPKSKFEVEKIKKLDISRIEKIEVVWMELSAGMEGNWQTCAFLSDVNTIKGRSTRAADEWGPHYNLLTAGN